MMTARVLHNGKALIEISANTDAEMRENLMLALLSAHTSPTLTHSELSYELEGTLTGETAQVLIECIHPKCHKKGKKLEGEIPRDLIGAAALTLHTAHEGHAMRVTVDGQTWESPSR